ncbi:hypothetical protein [Mycolicibacterium pulveris]
MDALWWLLLATVIVWQVRRRALGLRAASRRIDDDVAILDSNTPTT